MASEPENSRQKVAAIVSRPARPEVAKILPDLLSWLRTHNYKIILDPETAKYCDGEEQVLRSKMASHPLDLVIEIVRPVKVGAAGYGC